MGEHMCVLNKYFKNYSINKRKKIFYSDKMIENNVWIKLVVNSYIYATDFFFIYLEREISSLIIL